SDYLAVWIYSFASECCAAFRRSIHERALHAVVMGQCLLGLNQPHAGATTRWWECCTQPFHSLRSPGWSAQIALAFSDHRRVARADWSICLSQSLYGIAVWVSGVSKLSIRSRSLWRPILNYGVPHK